MIKRESRIKREIESYEREENKREGDIQFGK
jgi:hypothetical protein